jgi:methylglutaconyl-CoA hydratase
MAFEHLQSRRDGPIEHLTLNRPEVRNAFNDAVIGELTAWARAAASDQALRVVVLRGAGKVFSAGADANWMAAMIEYSHADNVRDAMRMAEMFLALDSLPVGVVGVVQGAALGGGAGLAAICDIVVAEEQAVFGFTEAKLGILPAVISPYVLPKIGVSAARELFLTGMRFSASRAREIGLVHAVVKTSELEETANSYVQELLSAAPSAVAASKALIPKVWQQSPAEAMEITTRAIASQRVSRDGQEGLRAFLGKRRPDWMPR